MLDESQRLITGYVRIYINQAEGWKKKIIVITYKGIDKVQLFTKVQTESQTKRLC